jgi:hypothetical protein
VKQLKNMKMTTIKTFEAGNIYEMRFIGDSDLRPKFICVKRTATTVTFERFQNPKESIKRKIKVYDNAEFIVDGNYSFAPVISADRIVG